MDGDPAPFAIGGQVVAPGEQRLIDLSVARLPTHTEVSIPVNVIHGRRSGPRLWLSAAVHGDELNGLEIIRRVLEAVTPQSLGGVLMAVPIVNVFGFLEQSRYMPDRRDLNRSFPGSKRGSLAARLAKLFMSEIVCNSTHGIDLHTAAAHRDNLPQIRADLEDQETRRCAEAFGANVTLHGRTRDGSLRAAAGEAGSTVLLYEAGQAQRFNRRAIDVGVSGVLQVMECLGMSGRSRRKPQVTEVVARRSTWVRARAGGILRRNAELGDRVERGMHLGFIANAFGEDRTVLRAPCKGIVIGLSLNPVVYQGDALVHVAQEA